jgi:hypothetical protein
MPSCRKATTRTSGSRTEPPRWLRATGPVAAALLVAGAVAGSLVVVPQPAVSDQPAAPDRVAAFMRAKLAHSQNVLEGLSVGDYDLIARGAHDLSLASQDSNWQVLQTEDYVRQSAEFRRSCDTLRAAAEAENLDAALVAWMDVTMKCVRCHRSMRDAE